MKRNDSNNINDNGYKHNDNSNDDNNKDTHYYY